MNFYELLLNRGQPSGEGMTHFERLFAAKLAGGGGEIKELEGVPPLLFKANGEPLIDWIIYGNMSQSGTPTPDNPIMPQGTGDKTANLIEGMFSGSIGTTGGITYSDQYVIYYVPVTAGETYTISGSYYVYAYYANKPTVGTVSAIDNERHFTVQGNTITAISGASWIGIRATSGDIPMVNLGSTPLPYEKYGYKIPISSASTTTPVYLGEVESTRWIKKLVLTGEETAWTKASSAKVFYLWQYDDDALNSANIISCMCSHYSAQGNVAAVSGVENLKCCFRTTAQTFYIHDDAFESKTDFVTYLQQQYANGTPVTVWYVLATPTTGIVNEPLRKIGEYADTLSMEQAGVEIPTIKGNNTLDIDTTLKPSNVYIKYKT